MMEEKIYEDLLLGMIDKALGAMEGKEREFPYRDYGDEDRNRAVFSLGEGTFVEIRDDSIGIHEGEGLEPFSHISLYSGAALETPSDPDSSRIVPIEGNRLAFARVDIDTAVGPLTPWKGSDRTLLEKIRNAFARFTGPDEMTTEIVGMASSNTEWRIERNNLKKTASVRIKKPLGKEVLMRNIKDNATMERLLKNGPKSMVTDMKKATMPRITSNERYSIAR